MIDLLFQRINVLEKEQRELETKLRVTKERLEDVSKRLETKIPYTRASHTASIDFFSATEKAYPLIHISALVPSDVQLPLRELCDMLSRSPLLPREIEAIKNASRQRSFWSDFIDRYETESRHRALNPIVYWAQRGPTTTGDQKTLSDESAISQIKKAFGLRKEAEVRLYGTTEAEDMKLDRRRSYAPFSLSSDTKESKPVFILSDSLRDQSQSRSFYRAMALKNPGEKILACLPSRELREDETSIKSAIFSFISNY